jgi:hypothetical protein
MKPRLASNHGLPALLLSMARITSMKLCLWLIFFLNHAFD